MSLQAASKDDIAWPGRDCSWKEVGVGWGWTELWEGEAFSAPPACCLLVLSHSRNWVLNLTSRPTACSWVT